MQLKLFEIAKDNNLNYGEFKLLVYIILMSDNDLQACFAANKRIGEDLGISKAYVSTRISSLKSKGLVKITTFPNGKIFPGEKVAKKLKDKKYRIWRLIYPQKVNKSLRVSTSLMVKGLSMANDRGFTKDKSPHLTTVKPTVLNKNCIKNKRTNYKHYEEPVPDYILPTKKSSLVKGNKDCKDDILSLMNKVNQKTKENKDERGIVL